MRSPRDILIVLLLSFWPAVIAAQGSADSFFRKDFFPMEKGTYWIYQGTVKWQGGDDSNTKSKNVLVKMEVIDYFHKGEISAALIKGHPADLAWYDPQKKPGDYLIVRNGDRFYFLQDASALDGYHNLINSGEPPSEQHLFFVLPLKHGGHFCAADQPESPHGFYCWAVDRIRPVYLWGIEGIHSRKSTEYQLSYRTVPDQEISYLASGIGITRWVYGHHGTVSDVDVRLVRFHRAAESK